MDMKQDMTEKNGVTDIILESISDGVFTVDHKWRIMSFNRAAEEITGITRSEAMGRYCWEVFRSNMCEGDCALKRTMKEGRSFVSTSTYIINADKKRIPINVSTSLLKNEQGEILGGVESFRDNSVVEALRQEINGRGQQEDMIAASGAMKTLVSTLPLVGDSDATVLIEGETGTGKEVMARAVHSWSSRKEKPFIAINCGALPDTLLESELFGYAKGAFTGAEKNKDGYFAAAEGGTIFLDEIGETSRTFQVKLLRVLEEKAFQPLGSVDLQRTDVRIVAATNRNLKDLVEHGDFRRDLFYRINIVCLQLPPLRERREDIPLLIEHFIEKMNCIKGKMVSGIDDHSMAALLTYDYPGNIRELENIIEHAFVLCSQGEIGMRHLPAYLLEHQPVRDRQPSSMARNMQQTETELILAALERNNFNRAAAARDLGVHKSTLFRKIKKLNIDLPGRDGRFSRLSFD